MGIDDRIRQEVDQFGHDLANALAARLRVVADQIVTVVAEERASADAEAMARFANDLANARAEAERATHAAVAQVRDEIERSKQAAIEEARTEAERASHAALAHARAEVELAAQDTIAEARAAAERASQEAIAQVRAEAERAKQDAVAQARTDAEHAQQDTLSRTRAEIEERFTADLSRARGEADAVRAHVGRLQEESDRLQGAVARLTDENAALTKAREAAQLDRDTAQRAKEAADRAREAANREREAAHRATEAELERRAAEREATIAALERLATAFRRVDAVSTLSDILGALGDAASAETARVAIFAAAPATPGSPPRFKAWRLHGFPPAPEKFDLGISSATELARTGLPFAPLAPSRAGVAIPIDVGGQTVAMIYADAGEGEQAAPAGWPDAVELLARHAAARIETVTAVRTAQVLGARTAGAPGDDQSARRYAKLLVSEIKMYNEANVRLGRSHRDLYDRLRPEIERARRLFEERVPARGAARQAFDDELVQILADGDASLLGLPPVSKRA